MLSPELSQAPIRRPAAPLVFTATIFLSASLLFFVQPLFAKIVLPVIGGAPAVWTTAMLFFQTVLICGYLYAHWMTRHLPVKLQALVHLALWAAALSFLPLAVPEGWQVDPHGAMAWQTLGLLAVGVGLPFAVLSANAPLLQSWYARTGGPSADDPYFLYGASNLGSLLALLAFPLLAEPIFGATAIGRGWAWGFAALGGMLLASAFLAREAAPCAAVTPSMPRHAIPARRIGRWLILAFVPSSLMLAVTTKIATDIGSMPLVWVVPLALYLFTFVLSFTRRPFLPLDRLRLLALLALAGSGAIFAGLGGFHLSLRGAALLVLCFFGIALFAHRSLYEERPDGANLTLFYVVMSVGGALGGLFNSILAPALFDGLYEGGLTTLVAALLVLSGSLKIDPRAALKAVAVGLGTSLPVVTAARAGLPPEALKLLLVALIGATALLFVNKDATAAALAAATVTLAGAAAIPDHILFRDRSFFGVHQVEDRDGLRIYSNGTTVHGGVRLADLADGRPQPIYYYHPAAPLAQILTSPAGRSARSVGVVGLGVGALACYASPEQSWQFYEIDPVVERVARNPDWFRFLADCAPDAPVHLGDARVVLAGQDGLAYDVLVIDAYSSDAVPVHLTTTEAMQLYLDRLTPGGLLIYHVSNRYYEIERPLARSAQALGLVARIQTYLGNPVADPANSPSKVVMMARVATDFGPLADDPRWEPLASDGARLWTDDYANLLSILQRRRADATQN